MVTVNEADSPGSRAMVCGDTSTVKPGGWRISAVKARVLSDTEVTVLVTVSVRARSATAMAGWLRLLASAG